MSIALNEEHRALAQTVSDLLAKHRTRAAARALLEAGAEPLPDFWAELAALGLLGLHIPADHGGSGFGLSETLVVAEQMGRQLAPGPYLPTVIASAVLAGALEANAVPAGTPSAGLAGRLLSGLADGSVVGAVALGGDVTFAGDTVTGDAGVVISGQLADVLLVRWATTSPWWSGRRAASRSPSRPTLTRAAERPGWALTGRPRYCSRARAGC
jgi:alkylation response protein AidB-like acyl-CoA dehydrogenase